MASYVEVKAESIESFLRSKSFDRTVVGNEVVYFRRSKARPSVQIKVYTSIRIGRTSARATGKDSIKVCVVFDDGCRRFGIGKFPHINRVHSEESVLARIGEKLQMAAARAAEWMREEDKKLCHYDDRVSGNEVGRREDEQEHLAYQREMEEEARREIAMESEQGRDADFADEIEFERRAACD